MIVRGGLNFPGDKSISHRALIMASLGKGESRLSNLSTGNDVSNTRFCLEYSGIKIRKKKDHVSVTGGEFFPSKYPLNCGNSGTTARLLMGLMAGQNIKAMFMGDESLSKRPMKRVLDPLSRMGITYESANDTLPVLIHPGKLNGIDFTPEVASAQVKSAVLLAGLGADGKTIVHEKVKTRDHTELLLKFLGADIEVTDTGIVVTKLVSPLDNFEMKIPGDPSTAAFFIGAAALLPGSELVLQNVLLNPTRTGFIDALQKMGTKVETVNAWEQAGEKAGTLIVRSGSMKGINITSEDAPGVIDEIPMLAILAALAEGESVFSGLEELRVKECDRIHAICRNLERMGVDIKEEKDGFIIQGGQKLLGTAIETFDDHRIAMAFSIAGLIAEGRTTLDNPECIAVSYPEFFNVLKGLIH